MRLLAPLSALLAVGASALRLPPQLSRRATVAAAVSALAAPLAAHADEGGAATCLGFGCSSPGDVGSTDLAPPGSIPYSQFLQAIKDKKVEGVIFQPPAGDVAYALIDGKSVRIGEGWPVEIANSWSSPTWVVRILENEGVPYGERPRPHVRELASLPVPPTSHALLRSTRLRQQLGTST